MRTEFLSYVYWFFGCLNVKKGQHWVSSPNCVCWHSNLAWQRDGISELDICFIRKASGSWNDYWYMYPMVNRIQSFALDKAILFQRAVVEDAIVDEFTPSNQERTIIATLLDRSFALANAETSNAIPLSLILNQLTGKWLQHLLIKTYANIYRLICELSWSEIFTLSQDEDWRKFISYINVFIGVVQDSWNKKYEVVIESCINKLSHSLSLLSLAKIIKKEAVDAAKNKLFHNGYFSEAQNMELLVETALDSYRGKYRVLLDVLQAIDIYAKRIDEKLTIEKKYSYLLSSAKKREDRNFEILR